MSREKGREIIFNKYGGRCAYCGCELKRNWHVDHLEPVKRKIKIIHQHWKHIDTGEILQQNEALRSLRNMTDREKWEHIPKKEVPDGCEYPERNIIVNMVPSCHSCNITKSSLSLDHFREYIEHTVDSLNNNRYAAYKFAKRYGLIQETVKPIVFYFETFKK